MNDSEMRDSLYWAVYEQFVGPKNEESKEAIKWQNPKRKYSAGILYPGASQSGSIREDEDFTTGDIVDSTSRMADSLSDYEEPVALSNADYQSAISMSICVDPSRQFDAFIHAAKYKRSLDGEGVPTYTRIPGSYALSDIPVPKETSLPQLLPVDGENLFLMVIKRHSFQEECAVVTVALVNKKSVADPHSCEVADCYFQCSVELSTRDEFLPLPKNETNIRLLTDEERSSKLIYSDIPNFAIGHGCATDWDDSGDRVSRIWTSTIPVAEVRPTLPVVPELPEDSFDMFVLGDASQWANAASSLKSLSAEYEKWINEKRAESEELPSWKKVAAADNLSQCDYCLRRMKKGIELIECDQTARMAFQLTNQAMLSQYLHYSVVSKEKTILREPAKGIRFWRPFQIAFILMNIESAIDPESVDRNVLDLIWFPTGGGKTEAYLGLSAFILLYERLCKEECMGTSIIMRYTLRLLSSQQFARASTLICALEMMRRSNSELLGANRFTVGFWAGGAASPNTWSDAMESFKALRGGKSVVKNPIPISQCPWCGHDMGGRGNKNNGYKRVRNRNKLRDTEQYLEFICPDANCDFGKADNSLPLLVVDEEIYLNPPSLLLGTVDKFALIPYREGSYSIFGIGPDGARHHAPKLIIQDELHLISGPLGSIAAQYETLIDELCTDRRNNTTIRPKIIASTATVARATEQCHQLFGCSKENVRQFPPSGISHSDSFFARLSESEGRRYVGIYAPNALSYATASIQLYSELLWEPNRWSVKSGIQNDEYWTVVGYYSSTRELGQALTWTSSDIPERLKEKMRLQPEIPKRYLNTSCVVELTGRKNASEVKKGLEDLAIKRGEKGCVDLCLATNMISVGLDVGRLGVMVMAGQPKETSEYIQASSRVGRGHSKGMVFVMYGVTRPRDRSHYENFKNYHESFYEHVEPSSITAFCPQVRDRALAGVLFGLYRALNPSAKTPNNPNDVLLEKVKSIISQRVEAVDPEELSGTMRQLDEIIERWKNMDVERWGSLNPKPFGNGEAPLPLMHGWGVKPNPEWQGQSFEVPLSMRSVDEECQVGIIERYPSDEEDV